MPNRKEPVKSTLKNGGVVLLPGAVKKKVATKTPSSRIPHTLQTPKTAALGSQAGDKAFTIADAIKYCVSNVIARSAANPTSNYRNYIVDEKSYINLWASLCLFLRNHNSHKPIFSVLAPNQHHTPLPVNILGIGVASHRTFNLGIKIPVFDLSKKFAQKYDLVQPKSISNGRPAPSSTLKINIKDLVDPSWNMNIEKAEFAIQSLVECIGRALKSGRLVNVDFGIGSFTGEKKVCTFNFTQRPDVVEDPKKNKTIGVSGRDLVSPRTMKIGESDQKRIAAEKLASKLTLDVSNLPSCEPTLTFSKEPTPRDTKSSPTHHIASEQLDSWVPIFSKKGPPVLSTKNTAPSNVDGEGRRWSTSANNGIAGSLSLDSVYDETAPPLIDNFSRLKCSTIGGADKTSSPSDKIGSFFSASATALYLDKKVGRICWAEGVQRGEDADQLVDVKPEDDVFGLRALKREEKKGTVATHVAVQDGPKEADGKEADDNADVDEEPPSAYDDSPKLSAKGAKRYLHYLNKGALSQDLIAPLDETMLKELKARFSSASPSKLASFLDEIQVMYSKSINKATLDYVLLSSAERARLSIEEIPADVRVPRFGDTQSTMLQQSPEIWSNAFASVKEWHESRGVILAPLTIVNAIWQDFSHLTLVSVPTNYKENLEQSNPQMTVVQFEQNHLAHIQGVVEEFRDKWLVGLRNMFEECVENTGAALQADTLHRYTKSWTVAMQSQLRTVVSHSVTSFLAFFEMFALEKEGEMIERGLNQNQEDKELSEFDYKRPPPPFIIDLVSSHSDGNSPVMLATSKEQVIERVLNVFEAMLHSFDSFETMHNLTRGGRTRRLKVMSKREPFLVNAKARIIHILEENLTHSEHALERYSKFKYLSDKSAGDDIDEDAHLEDVEAAIQKFHDSSMHILALPPNIPIVLINLTTSGFHKSLIDMAERSVLETIDKIVSRCMSVSHDVTKSARTLWNKLSKKPTNTDELIETETFLQRVKSTDLPALESEVSIAKEQVDFLLAHQSLHTETLDTVNSTFRQLRELKSQFERADGIAHAQRLLFESNCRTRKKHLLTQLGKVDAGVNEFNFKSDMKSMVQKYLEELDQLARLLDDARLSAGIINAEETKLGWNVTDFVKITEVEDKMEPFKELWSIAFTFRSEYASWTRSPIFNLDGVEVEKNFNMMLEKMKALKGIFEDNDVVGPGNVAESIIEKLDSYAMYIPLILALTNKRLNNLHWKSIGDIMGFEISKDDASVSWTNLMAQGALGEENIEKIKELNDGANKEVDVLIFTEYINKMEVDADLLRVILGVDDKHPWAQSVVYIVDNPNMDNALRKVEHHLTEIDKIEESVNGGDFLVICAKFKKLFEFAAQMGGLLVDAGIVWFDIVHQKQLTKEQKHQLTASDEAWRALLTELAVDGGTRSTVTGADRLVEGYKFKDLLKMEESHFAERISEILEVLKTVKKGDDARKAMRRMSRRQSNLNRASIMMSKGGTDLRHALNMFGTGKKL